MSTSAADMNPAGPTGKAGASECDTKPAATAPASPLPPVPMLVLAPGSTFAISPSGACRQTNYD